MRFLRFFFVVREERNCEQPKSFSDQAVWFIHLRQASKTGWYCGASDFPLIHHLHLSFQGHFLLSGRLSPPTIFLGAPPGSGSSIMTSSGRVTPALMRPPQFICLQLGTSAVVLKDV